jgi:hypothetical protein
MPRTLITNRTPPRGADDWSGCRTMLGLHIDAASGAYSWVNVAPRRSHRSLLIVASAGTRLPMRSACWLKVPMRSR